MDTVTGISHSWTYPVNSATGIQETVKLRRHAAHPAGHHPQRAQRRDQSRGDDRLIQHGDPHDHRLDLRPRHGRSLDQRRASRRAASRRSRWAAPLMPRVRWPRSRARATQVATRRLTPTTRERSESLREHPACLRRHALRKPYTYYPDGRIALLAPDRRHLRSVPVRLLRQPHGTERQLLTAYTFTYNAANQLTASTCDGQPSPTAGTRPTAGGPRRVRPQPHP